MRTKRLQFVFAILSFASPFIAFFGTEIYQSYRDTEFWRTLTPGDDASNTAGAMMAIAEVIETFVVVLCGSFIGLLFAGVSLWGRWRKMNIGWFAAAFNLLPFIGFILLLLRGGA